MAMTKNEALERAGVIWSGLSHGIQMEAVGSGCYVRIEGDDRIHRLDWNGYVTCKHSDCINRELDANARVPLTGQADADSLAVAVTELSDADGLAKAKEVYAWLEKAMLAGASQDDVLKYLTLELQRMFIQGARAGANDLHREIKKGWNERR